MRQKFRVIVYVNTETERKMTENRVKKEIANMLRQDGVDSQVVDVIDVTPKPAGAKA